MIESFVLDGTVTLVALAVLVLEIAMLVGVALLRGERPATHLIANALSGLFLILALRAALLESGAYVIAACLGLAFVAHLADTVSRMVR